MQIKLIVDTDCGMDDIFALSLLDKEHVHISFISTVSGLTIASVGEEIIGDVCANFQSKPKICRGESVTAGLSKLDSLDWIHDYRTSQQTIASYIAHNCRIDVGVEKCANPAVEVADIHQESLLQLIHYLQSLPVLSPTLSSNATTNDEVVLLCLGPLTNIAHLLKQQPDILSSHINCLVIMGGTLQFPGVSPEGAELNFYLDPQAAYDVIRYSGVGKIDIIGLDVVNDNACTHAAIAAILQNSAGADGVGTTGPQDGGNCSSHNGANGANTDNTCATRLHLMRYLADTFPDCVCYDSIAAYYLINPSAFNLTPMSVHVDPNTGVMSVRGDANPPVLVDDSVFKLPHFTEVHVATNFDRQIYLNYLSSVFNHTDTK